MSSWSYRIVKYHDGSGYGLHEVYYDDAGKPQAMTKDPIDFDIGPDSDDGGADTIRKMLATAAKDAKDKPVLDEPANDEWPGEAL